MNEESKKLYRVECVCANVVGQDKEGKDIKCSTFLMGSNKKPHLTAEEIHKKWTGMVLSAPLNAPRCPKCKYSTGSDYNARTNFLIDDGEKKVTSEEWFKNNP